MVLRGDVPVHLKRVALAFILASRIAAVRAEPRAEVVRALLVELAADRAAFPDAALLPRSGRIPVIAPATPRDPPRAFAPATLVALQRIADRERRLVPFVHVFRVSTAGPRAVVLVGVDVAAPSSGPHPECCCISEIDYARRRNRWVRAAAARVTCS
jgi:hypothetical protein